MDLRIQSARSHRETTEGLKPIEADVAVCAPASKQWSTPAAIAAIRFVWSVQSGVDVVAGGVDGHVHAAVEVWVDGEGTN